MSAARWLTAVLCIGLYYRSFRVESVPLIGLVLLATYLTLHRIGDFMFAAYLLALIVFFSFFLLRIRVVSDAR
jgi:hypothetical protein